MTTFASTSSPKSEQELLNDLFSHEPSVIGAEYKRQLPITRISALLAAVGQPLTSRKSNVTFFASADRSKDTHLIAFETAYAASLQRGASVLFLNMSNTSKAVFLAVENLTTASLDALLAGRQSGKSPFVSIKDTGLFYASLQDFGQNLPIETLNSLFDKLREQFGLIVTFSDAALSDGSIETLSKQIDDFVLVTEAEHSRAPVVAELKSSIESRDRKIIGAVLSNRRVYIPQFLYRALYKTRGA